MSFGLGLETEFPTIFEMVRNKFLPFLYCVFMQSGVLGLNGYKQKHQATLKNTEDTLCSVISNIWPRFNSLIQAYPSHWYANMLFVFL